MPLTADRTLTVAVALLGAADMLWWLVWVMAAKDRPGAASAWLAAKLLLAVLMFLVVRSRVTENKRGCPPPALLAGVFLFLFSGLGAFVLILRRRSLLAGDIGTGAVYHIDREEGIDAPVDLLRERNDLSELTKVAPLVDVLAHPRPEMGIAAVQALNELAQTYVRGILRSTGEPVSSESSDVDSLRRITRLLKQAQYLGSGDVQYYANDALRRIADDFTETVRGLLEKVNREAPDYETFRRLAESYAQLGGLEIEHDVLNRFYRSQASRYYTHLLQNHPQHRTALIERMIALAYADGDWRRCLELCDEARDIETLRARRTVFEARCLFHLRRLSELQRLTRDMPGGSLTALKRFVELTESSTHE